MHGRTARNVRVQWHLAVFNLCLELTAQSHQNVDLTSFLARSSDVKSDEQLTFIALGFVGYRRTD